MVGALKKEIILRKDYLAGDSIETIYFGGGTPSLLKIEDLRLIIEEIKNCFNVNTDAEITLEANPDDINKDILEGWKKTGINRLSIGVQSFFEEDLRWMNRAHNAGQANSSLQWALKYFDNISADLIYGFPILTNEKWQENVDRMISLGIPHLSCYALTVEPKTALHKQIQQKKTSDVDPERQSRQFLLLMSWMQEAGYEHYEISNFAKPGYRSRHNSSYWQGKKYLGIGPSAHSYDLISRQWNISNNARYIESLDKGIIPYEREELTAVQKNNEYIMTSLRTAEGIDLSHFQNEEQEKLLTLAGKYIAGKMMTQQQQHLRLTQEGKLLADGIAANLFF